MSSLVKKFSSRILPIILGASTAFAAVNANAEMPLTCHVSPEAIAAAQKQILTTEGMVPVATYHVNIGNDQAPKWGKATLMMNPTTRKGYQWARNPDNTVCINKSYSNVQLFANNRLDAAAFLDKGTAPKVNLVGNGKDFSTMGMNAALLISEKRAEYPMYRADVDNILTGGNSKLTTKYTEVLVGNPNTGEGTVLASRPDGSMIKEYLRVVGTPQRDGVAYGAIYTPEGKKLIGE